MCHVGEQRHGNLNFGNTVKIKDRRSRTRQNFSLVLRSLNWARHPDPTPSCLLHVRPHCNYLSHYAFLWGKREIRWGLWRRHDEFQQLWDIFSKLFIICPTYRQFILQQIPHDSVLVTLSLMGCSYSLTAKLHDSLCILLNTLGFCVRAL